MNRSINVSTGFTLIEISIVLVVVGLLVGGVLTGRDLIDSASQRAQIAQIEKYQIAAHTFQVKFGYLPGDIPDPYASQFGFKPRDGGIAGTGDGDGFLLGYNAGATAFQQSAGETALFWVDLSTAGLIDGGFNTATATGIQMISGSALNSFFPTAKIGNSNFLYVYERGYLVGGFGAWVGQGDNWYGLSPITQVNTKIYSNPGLTVQQAYGIDKKVDDGLPQSGSVQVFYHNYPLNTGGVAWAAGSGNIGANDGQNPPGPTTNVTPYQSYNCYDNSYAGGSAATQKYQLQNASLQNCALSFRFQ